MTSIKMFTKCIRDPKEYRGVLVSGCETVLSGRTKLLLGGQSSSVLISSSSRRTLFYLHRLVPRGRGFGPSRMVLRGR